MKKFFIILLVLILLVLSSIVIISVSSRNDVFTKKNYSLNLGEIKNIIISVEDREIEVAESPDEKIYIEYYESEKEYYTISNENNTLTLNIKYNKTWLDYFGTKPNKDYRKIYLQLPNNLLKSIQITTTNESIKLNNISVLENLTLNSNGGNLEFNKVSVGKEINLTTKNGNIAGSILGSLNDFSISCDIKKGTSNLPNNKEEGAKSLFVSCNNGNINIDFVS